MKNTTIDINGIKLDTEAQIKLTGVIKNYVYGLKQIESEKENPHFMIYMSPMVIPSGLLCPEVGILDCCS